MSAQAVQTLLFSIAALLAALTLALNAYTSQQLFWVVNALYRDADFFPFMSLTEAHAHAAPVVMAAVWGGLVMIYTVAHMAVSAFSPSAKFVTVKMDMMLLPTLSLIGLAACIPGTCVIFGVSTDWTGIAGLFLSGHIFAWLLTALLAGIALWEFQLARKGTDNCTKSIRQLGK